MRVLLAPDRYAALLTATAAAEALAAGWAAAADDDLVLAPATDAGPGLLEVLAAARGGELELVLAHDPWGREVPATVLLVADRRGRTAYVEAAQVAGADSRRPGDAVEGASTAGVGELLAAALDLGARRIVVGLEGAVALDAGLGAVGALLGDGGERLLLGAGGLAHLHPQDLRGLEAVRARLAGIELVALGELDRPLLGLAGVAATEAPGLGADAATAQRIETALGHAVHVVRTVLGEPLDLLTGMPLRWDRRPGAGAGAGLGFGLGVLGARAQDGPTAGVAEAGLAQVIPGVDLLVTGTAVLGPAALRGSVVTALSAVAAAHGIPVVAVCGRVDAGRRETMAAGLSGVYGIVESLGQWPGFAADPAGRLRARAEAVARTWSPRR